MTSPAILVADDDPVNLRLVSNLLAHRFDARILTASCGSQARALIDHHSHDIKLVVLDLHMPGCDGVEVLMHLAERAFQAGVILMSASAALLPMVDGLARAMGLQLLGALPKPIAADAFPETADWLRRQPARFADGLRVDAQASHA